MNAPRTTAKILDDLMEAIVTIDADIDYLEGTIPTYEKKSPLRQRFVDRYEKLIRARNWIAGKVEAERAKREEG